ncbi:MAG: AAA family ATPase [Deltaproteobacteria bacterium]|nr:AAA family ATPase [Deltaproteobacteria bacterium]MBW2009483.1 AAA family ATPase [Deltaproteobacteria bacterium]RLB32895.1 MAG: carbon monoxide dehydrogenase [Deltaproteobacteria bacterium]
MSYSIALAGKGGTGKTTLAGLAVKYLVEKGKRPVLAVDADSNANLNEVLGLEVSTTLGQAREEMKKGVSAGMTKDVFMEMRLQEAVVEAEGFDLIVMGRPEGAGCYCAANTLLTQYLDRLIDNYPYIVMDNEAGMEHISRLTTNNIDMLLVVSDPTRRGLQAAARIVELTEELNLSIRKKLTIVNQARDGQEPAILESAGALGLRVAGFVPEDEELAEFDLQGRPTTLLGPHNRAVSAAYRIFDEILEKE